MTESEHEQRSVTQMLGDLRNGKEDAVNDLFPLVYRHLHKMAQTQRKYWHGDHTLNTTALVHEAYIKLVDQSNATWNSRAHFYCVAAKAMRQILINYAKFRKRKKRGGDQARVSLDEQMLPAAGAFDLTDDRADLLVALNEALERLERFSTRQSKIVECRFFGGMSIADTAEALHISPATVKRGWAMAQAWLYKELQPKPG